MSGVREEGPWRYPFWICCLPKRGTVRVRAGRLDYKSWLRSARHLDPRQAAGDQLCAGRQDFRSATASLRTPRAESASMRSDA
jgi:hypothetical protein